MLPVSGRLRAVSTALGLGALLALVLWAARPVQAHAAFVRSDPPPNAQLPAHVHEVTIWFSEPLEPQFSEIQVLNSQGQRVDEGDSRVHEDDPTAMSVSLHTLPPGTYTVAWRNVSTVDGHALRGSFVFSFGDGAETGAGATRPDPVGGAGAGASAAEALARGLVLAGALALVGGLAFEFLLLRPVFFAPRRDGAVAHLGATLVRRSRRLLWIAAILFAAASVWQLLLQTATVFGAPVGSVGWIQVDAVLSDSAWGQLWMVRGWLFLVAAAGLGMAASPVALEGELEEEDAISRLARFVALAVGLALLLTISLSSHAAAMGPLRAPALFSDYVHLLAAALWVGGLFHLALGARPLYREVQANGRRQLLQEVVNRFSTLALLSVGMLVITGLYSTWAQVTTAPALATPYGLTLLGKLALFLPMLALGALNLLRHAPRLRAEASAGRWLRRAVSAEALLGLVVLLVVGLLTSLEPARQAADREGLGQRRELTFQETVERTDISLAVEPALAGENRFVITLRDPQGRPVANADEVLLELTYLDTELGETSATAQATADGQYVAEDLLLSVAGEWQVGVLVRRPDAFDARAAFRFDVLAGAGPTLDASRGYILWGLELVLLGALFLGVALWRGGRRRQPALTGLGAIGLAAGLALVAGGPLLLEAQEASQRNPIPPTAQSVARGQALYADNCQSCHGPQAQGDGPLAETLERPPANLALHVPRHADAELLAVIGNGLPASPMPGFAGQLSEEEMWHLINYLRSLPDE